MHKYRIWRGLKESTWVLSLDPRRDKLPSGDYELILTFRARSYWKALDIFDAVCNDKKVRFMWLEKIICFFDCIWNAISNPSSKFNDPHMMDPKLRQLHNEQW